MSTPAPAAQYYALVEGSLSDMRDDRLLEVRRVSEPAIYPYLSGGAKERVESMVPGGQPTMPYILSEAARVMRQVLPSPVALPSLL